MPGLSHFDFLAPIYEKAIRVKAPDDIIRLLHLPTTGKLLDVGGGTGRISEMLRGLAAKIIVADVSFGMLHQAKNKDGLDIVCAQSEVLPFLDHEFDRILMVDALHHVYNAQRTIQELWRVLKPGGRLLIEEPDIRKPTVIIVAILEKITLMRSKFYSPPKIASFLDDVVKKDAAKNYPRAAIECQGYTAWISIEK
jgi:ubiquinone/menaquinone biosynthesis C-methylase UbiE